MTDIDYIKLYNNKINKIDKILKYSDSQELLNEKNELIEKLYNYLKIDNNTTVGGTTEEAEKTVEPAAPSDAPEKTAEPAAPSGAPAKTSASNSPCPLKPEDEEFFNLVDQETKTTLLNNFNTFFQSSFKEEDIKQILVILARSQSLVSSDNEAEREKVVTELKGMSNCFFENDPVGKGLAEQIGSTLRNVITMVAGGPISGIVVVKLIDTALSQFDKKIEDLTPILMGIIIENVTVLTDGLSSIVKEIPNAVSNYFSSKKKKKKNVKKEKKEKNVEKKKKRRRR